MVGYTPDTPCGDRLGQLNDSTEVDKDSGRVDGQRFVVQHSLHFGADSASRMIEVHIDSQVCPSPAPASSIDMVRASDPFPKDMRLYCYDITPRNHKSGR
jgi:hypothetical protein